VYSRRTQVRLRKDLLVRAASVIIPSVGVFSYYGLENYVVFHCKFVVKLTVQLGFAEYVETLYRVHQSSFVGEEKGVHDVIHGADGVSVLYQVLGETGFAISVFEVAQVFSEAGVERLLVCPVYFMLQVGKVIWYIPDFSYLLFCGGWWFPIRSAFNVFLVESVTLILVFLKALVIALVSLPQ